MMPLLVGPNNGSNNNINWGSEKKKEDEDILKLKLTVAPYI
jgi:hypothetical protein